ncbi:MAG TPA: helix-turn-helix domain-containing protein [Mycobacteriales bacterium]|nr:helix-turn-helix domain-containing protein [Mycobacteriales bacterium]
MTDAATLLRYARRRAGLSQRALAINAGVSATCVERIEVGNRTQFATVARLLETCGLVLIPAPTSPSQRLPEVRTDPKIRPVHRLFPQYRRGDPLPSVMRVLDRVVSTQAVVIGRAAAVLLGAEMAWTHIELCPGPTDVLPADELVILRRQPGGLSHAHLRRTARYLDTAMLPMPRVAALFVADPLDLLVMAIRDDDDELITAARAVLDAERRRPLLDQGGRRYPAHSQAREGDRLDPFAAVWRPVRRRRPGASTA